MKRNSLTFHIWVYFVIFAFFILFMFFFLQIVLFNGFYTHVKKNDMKAVASEVVNSYSNYNYLTMLSYKNNVCIEFVEDDYVSYTSGASSGCLVNDSKSFNKLKKKFIESSDTNTTFTVRNVLYNNEVLVYAQKIDRNHYIFLSTPLKLTSAITTSLNKQILYGIITVFLISFLIAYFVSKKVSTPIIKINEESKKMGKGDYDVKFDVSSTDEINELALTLSKVSKELEKTEKLRRELMANVSHDLKTPLTLIKANAEMVRDITYKNEEKRNASLSVIINEVDRLNLLVEDILTLSKTQSGTLELELKKINLNDFLNNILTRYEVLKDKEKYIIKLNCEKTYYIKADFKRLEQVIYNLINNAINYTGDDKTVSVNVVDKGTYIRLEVVDTGKGIKDEDLPYIWDKYYKVDKSFKRVTIGTGLGLSIVKNILQLHKFNYGVETGKKGTKFYFDIPKL